MACYDGNDYLKAEEIRADGIIKAGHIRQAQAAIVALLNGKSLVDNYTKQYDIADDAMSNAEEQQAHLRNVFWPRELDFLKEFASPQDVEDAQVKGRRYAGRLISTVAGKFAEEMRKLDCSASRYCTSARSKAVQDLLLLRSQAMANARALGRIMGYLDVKKREDRNFKRRVQALGLGKGLMQTAASLEEGAAKDLASVGQELSGQLSSALESFGFGRAEVIGGQNRMDALNNWHPEGTTKPMQFTANPVDRGNRIKNATIPQTGFGFLNQGETGLPVGLGNNLTQGFDDNLTFGETESQVQQDVAYGGFDNLQFSGPEQFRAITEERPNDGRIGNRDLARVGKARFVDSGGHTVIVDMGQFKLGWVDSKKAGDK